MKMGAIRKYTRSVARDNIVPDVQVQTGVRVLLRATLASSILKNGTTGVGSFWYGF